MPELFHGWLVTSRSDIPNRTKIDPPAAYSQNRRALFGKQEIRCTSSLNEIPFRILDVGHAISRIGGRTVGLTRTHLSESPDARLTGFDHRAEFADLHHQMVSNPHNP